MTLVLDLNRAAYPVAHLVGGSEWAIVIAASLANALIGSASPWASSATA